MKNKIIHKTKPIEHRFEAMGGEFQFFTYSNKFSEKQIESLFLKAESEVHRIEDKLTDFRESPFNLINENAGVKETKVDDEILSLIEKSIEFSKSSKGIFDISFASVGHLWREAKKKNETMNFLDRIMASYLINYQKIQIDRKNKTVFLPHKKMRIGLGGIGKGYAVDKAFEILEKSGLENFYVNGSGDIRVHSRKDAPRKWKFGIQNPFSTIESKQVGMIQLSHGSVSTSGGYVKKNKMDGKKADHHIIKSKGGFSHSSVIATTVYAKDAITSDCIATTLMNMNPRQGLKFLDELNLTGIIITKSGKSYLSKKALKNFGM